MGEHLQNGGSDGNLESCSYMEKKIPSHFWIKLEKNFGAKCGRVEMIALRKAKNSMSEAL